MNDLDRVKLAVETVRIEHKQLVDLAGRLAGNRTTLRALGFTGGMAIIGLGSSANQVVIVGVVFVLVLILALIDGITEALYRHLLARARTLEGVFVAYRDLLSSQGYQEAGAEERFWEEFSRYEPGPYRRLPAVGVKAGLAAWKRRPLHYLVYGLLILAALIAALVTGPSGSLCEQVVPSAIDVTVDDVPVEMSISCEF